MNSPTPVSKKNQNQLAAETPAAVKPKAKRERDSRLDERDAQVKAWKDAGKKGVPEAVKAADFKRVAQRRLDDALNALRLLANCGRRTTYGYTNDQAAKLIGAVRAAVDDLEREFTPEGADSNSVEL